MVMSAFYCAASSLIRRRAFERPWRFLTTQAYQHHQQRLVAPPPPPPFISCNQPLLTVSICNDPTSPNLYNITKDKNNLFHLHKNNVGFPDPHTTITAPGRYLVGFSQGFFISVSLSSPFDIRAINPVTGASLGLPPVSDDIDPKCVKVILSPSLDKAILLHSRPCPTDGIEPEFGFARLPASSWIPLSPDSMCYPLHNCIFHKGRLFMVDDFGDVAIFDDNFFDNPSASSAPLVWRCEDHLPQYDQNAGSHHVLVESPDGADLYFLLQFHFHIDCKTCYFKVHKLDENSDTAAERWKEVESIGDLAMFVGWQHSYALRATNFPALEPNVIYFSTSFPKEEMCPVREGDGYDTGVYYLRSKCVHHFDVTGKHDHFLNTHMWFQPAAF